jgi:hypothetical protein
MNSKFLLGWVYFVELCCVALGIGLGIVGFNNSNLLLVVIGTIISVVSLLLLCGTIASNTKMCQDDAIREARASLGPPTIIIESDNPVNIVYRERPPASKRTLECEQDPSAIV